MRLSILRRNASEDPTAFRIGKYPVNTSLHRVAVYVLIDGTARCLGLQAIIGSLDPRPDILGRGLCGGYRLGAVVAKITIAGAIMVG